MTESLFFLNNTPDNELIIEVAERTGIDGTFNEMSPIRGHRTLTLWHLCAVHHFENPEGRVLIDKRLIKEACCIRENNHALREKAISATRANEFSALMIASRPSFGGIQIGHKIRTVGHFRPDHYRPCYR